MEVSKAESSNIPSKIPSNIQDVNGCYRTKKDAWQAKTRMAPLFFGLYGMLLEGLMG